MPKGNAIAGQSGGPTSVINSSLAGIVKAAKDVGEITGVFGMRWGIEGFMAGDIVDLGAEDRFANVEYGVMVSLCRQPDPQYKCTTGTSPLCDVAVRAKEGKRLLRKAVREEFRYKAEPGQYMIIARDGKPCKVSAEEALREAEQGKDK